MVEVFLLSLPQTLVTIPKFIKVRPWQSNQFGVTNWNHDTLGEMLVMGQEIIIGLNSELGCSAREPFTCAGGLILNLGISLFGLCHYLKHKGYLLPLLIKMGEGLPLAQKMMLLLFVKAVCWSGNQVHTILYLNTSICWFISVKQEKSPQLEHIIRRRHLEKGRCFSGICLNPRLINTWLDIIYCSQTFTFCD